MSWTKTKNPSTRFQSPYWQHAGGPLAHVGMVKENIFWIPTECLGPTEEKSIRYVKGRYRLGVVYSGSKIFTHFLVVLVWGHNGKKCLGSCQKESIRNVEGRHCSRVVYSSSKKFTHFLLLPVWGHNGHKYFFFCFQLNDYDPLNMNPWEMWNADTI